jgi:uncharacterized membrane protein YecN with MAPEG domain
MPGTIAVVGLYAGLNALIMLWIGASTGMLRAKYKISIGDGGNLHMTRILRGHANAVENVPIALILMVIMSAMGAPALVLHGLGAALTIGRFFHAMHFIKEDAPGWQRGLGATLSILVVFLSAVGVAGHALVNMF